MAHCALMKRTINRNSLQYSALVVSTSQDNPVHQLSLCTQFVILLFFFLQGGEIMVDVKYCQKTFINCISLHSNFLSDAGVPLKYKDICSVLSKFKKLS